jgi:hypothetical protein
MQCGTTKDPKRSGEPEYTVRLLGPIITVGLETMNVVKASRSLDK